MSNIVKAIEVEIFENKDLGNCSNDGISNRYNTILVLHERGGVEIDLNNPPENACKFIEADFGSHTYKYIEPLAPVKKGHVGYMAGGSFAYSCESRFHDFADYPLAIHDRQEDHSLYSALSD